mmetsp:Transcript_24531/g.74807  ORF Transcript_24531/g.74807 Transcript_24531/m.74807 type:complete len:232 (-) Transcript_24531:212-907(-)
MDLRAGTAGARVAHFPEILLHSERHHAIGGKVLQPDLLRLIVARHPKCLVTSEVRCVKAVCGNGADVGQELPRPLDCLLLEIIAERPVAAHLEESVVVDVLTHIVEIIVFAARTDALLRVARTLELCEPRVWVSLSEEDGLELVHPRVDEEERRVIVRHDGRGGPEGVLRFVLKEVDVCVAHVGHTSEDGVRSIKLVGNGGDQLCVRDGRGAHRVDHLLQPLPHLVLREVR